MTTSFNFVGLNEREMVANEAKDFKSVLVMLNEVFMASYFALSQFLLKYVLLCDRHNEKR